MGFVGRLEVLEAFRRGHGKFQEREELRQMHDILVASIVKNDKAEKLTAERLAFANGILESLGSFSRKIE